MPACPQSGPPSGGGPCPIGDDTCQSFVAHQADDCSWQSQCEECIGYQCSPVAKFDKYWVSDWGTLQGVTNIKAEVQARRSEAH